VCPVEGTTAKRREVRRSEIRCLDSAEKKWADLALHNSRDVAVKGSRRPASLLLPMSCSCVLVA